MLLENIDFHSIRPVNGSKEKGFEEFVCQLAKREKISDAVSFTRNGTPDGGIECYWTLSDGKKWAWQAKYFQNSLGDSQFQQIENSLKTALTDNNIIKYFIAIPIDPPSPKTKGKTSMREKWDTHIYKWKKLYPNTEIVAWWCSEFITLLQQPGNSALIKFWFDKMFLGDPWFSNQNEIAIHDLGPRYSPEINVEVDSSRIFDGIAKSEKIAQLYVEKLDLLLQELRKFLRYDTSIHFSLGRIKQCIDGLVQTYTYINESTSNNTVNFSLVRSEIKKLRDAL